jgi:Ca2+-binding RTX toxin-like protein
MPAILVGIGDTFTVDSSGTVETGPDILGGYQFVSNSSWIIPITDEGLVSVLAGGFIYNAEPFGGGTLNVYSGGVIGGGEVSTNATVTIYTGGTVNNFTVAASGLEVVSSGGTVSTPRIADGMLRIADGGIVTGPIGFDNTVNTLHVGTLEIDAASMPTNLIFGFAPGDTVDLAGVPFDPHGQATLDANNILHILENGHTFNLNFDPSKIFQQSFQLSSDGKGGTDIRLGKPTLFTSGADIVDFNSLTSSQAAVIANGADIYNGLGGNDIVTLPNMANYNENVGNGQTLGWLSGSPFSAGDTAGQTYTITGGDGNDTIKLGDGNDIVYGSPGNDTITGGAGQDNFVYQGPYPVTAGSNQAFGNFNGFTAGTVQTITGGHTTFVTDSTKQNLLLLPGSSNDYTVSVNFQTSLQFLPDSLAATLTTLTTTGSGGLPQGVSIATTDVEKVDFAQPIPITNNNQVALTGGNIAVEMLQLASESYGSDTGHHGAEPLAYQGGTDTFLNATAAAQSRGWHAVAAMELGIAPADFGQGTFKYSFVNGVYQAIDPNPSYSVNNDPAEADAIVLIGNVNGQRTLAISFTGSDQIADFTEYSNFQNYYSLFAPLVKAVQGYLLNSDNGIQQVLVSGHSLGAPMVQYLLQDLPATQFPNVHGFTDGSPGAEVDWTDLRIENFIHAGLGDADALALSTSSLNSALMSINSGHGDPVPLLGEATQNKADLLQEIYALGSQLPAGSDTPDGVVLKALKGLPFVSPKTRTPINILIDDDVTNAPTTAAFFGDQHNFNNYVTDLQKVITFAGDLASPFVSSQAAIDLLTNTTYPGTIRIAVGQFDRNYVHVYSGDQYVLGYMAGYTSPFFSGDQIVWDSPAAAGTVLPTGGIEAMHIVDGGKSTSNSVLLPGASSDYVWVYHPTSGETDLYYRGASQGPFDGQIGQLYRIANLEFTDNPNQLVPVNQPGVQYIQGAPGQPLSGPKNGPATLAGSNLQDQTITGGNGPTTLIGGTNDTLSARNGNDTVIGGANDTTTLGNGNNTVFGGSSNTITLGNGTDLVVSGDPSTITLGNGNDTVDGRDGDKITVGNGNDTISGGNNETITVGNGNDHLTVGSSCTITLGKGNDTIVFTPSSSSNVNETITGLSARDTLDFTEVNFATVAQPIFSGTKAGGTLTVTDGTNTANISLIGNYLNSSWTVSSDGSGGTTLVDPPLLSPNDEGPTSSLSHEFLPPCDPDLVSSAWTNDLLWRDETPNAAAYDPRLHTLVQAIAGFGSTDTNMHSNGILWQNTDSMTGISDFSAGNLGFSSSTAHHGSGWHVPT